MALKNTLLPTALLNRLRKNLKIKQETTGAREITLSQSLENIP
jgi:hypothetical protein